MDKTIFIDAQEKLAALVNERLSGLTLPRRERESLVTLLRIINEYSFENRLKLKGYISHVIIDSLVLDYALGEECIEFDRSIQ